MKKNKLTGTILTGVILALLVTLLTSVTALADTKKSENTTLKLNKTSVSIYLKGTATIKATIGGKKGTVKWKSSNTSVATVNSNGKITGKKVGTATITATVNGVKKTCKVTVKKPAIKLDKKTVSIQVGKTVTLKATVQGASKKITWSSSNDQIATVSNKGVIKGVKKGTVTITAKANGVKATCNVTILTSNTASAASTTTVYVISSINGKETALSYNSKGLLSNVKSGSEVYSYTYDSKGNLSNLKVTGGMHGQEKYTYTYASGKISKRVYANAYGKITTAYNWKGNQCTATTKDGTQISKSIYTFSSYGVLQSVTSNSSDREGILKDTYTYDKYGNLSSYKYENSAYPSFNETTIYKNKYENGRLVKVSIPNQYSQTFTYKKIKVSKAYVQKVKAQQNYILVNCFGGWNTFFSPANVIL